MSREPMVKFRVHAYRLESMVTLDVSVPHSFELWEERDDKKARTKAKEELQRLSKEGKLKWKKPDAKILVIDLGTLEKL